MLLLCRRVHAHQISGGLTVDERILANVDQAGTGAGVGVGVVDPEGGLAGCPDVRRHQHAVHKAVVHLQTAAGVELADHAAGVIRSGGDAALVVDIFQLDADLVELRLHVADDTAGLAAARSHGSAAGAVRDGDTLGIAHEAAGHALPRRDGNILRHIDTVNEELILREGGSADDAAHVLGANDLAVAHRNAIHSHGLFTALVAVHAANADRRILGLLGVRKGVFNGAAHHLQIIGISGTCAAVAALVAAHEGGALDGAVQDLCILRACVEGIADGAAGATAGSCDLHIAHQPISLIRGAVTRGTLVTIQAAHGVGTGHLAVHSLVAVSGFAEIHTYQTAHVRISVDHKILDGVAHEVGAIGLHPTQNAAHIIALRHADLHVFHADIGHIGAGVGHQTAAVICAAALVRLRILHHHVLHLDVVQRAAGRADEAEVAAGIAVATDMQRVELQVFGTGHVEDRTGHGAVSAVQAREVEAHVGKGQVLHTHGDLGDPGQAAATVADIGEAAGAVRAAALETVEQQLLIVRSAASEVHNAHDVDILTVLAVFRNDGVPVVKIMDLPIADVGLALLIVVSHHDREVTLAAVLGIFVLDVQGVGIQRVLLLLGGDGDESLLPTVADRSQLHLGITQRNGGVGEVHTVEVDGQIVLIVSPQDRCAVHTGMAQPRLDVVFAAVGVDGLLHPQGGVAALTGQGDILLLPALPLAVIAHLGGAAAADGAVIPLTAQPDLILPGGGTAQLLAGEKSVGVGAFLVLLQLAGDLALVGVESGSGHAALPDGLDTVGIGAGAGHVAHSQGADDAVTTAADAAGIVTAGLQNVHIAPALANEAGVACGDGTVDTAHIAAAGLDAAVRIAGFHGVGADVAHQTAHGVDDRGVGDIHGQIAGVAILDVGYMRITHQAAGIQVFVDLVVRQRAVHHGAALHHACGGIAHQHTEVAAAGNAAILHADVFHPALGKRANKGAAVRIGCAGGGNDQILHKEVPDHAALAHAVNEIGVLDILQLDILDDMLLTVQLACELARGGEVGRGTVEHDLDVVQLTALAEIKVLSELVVPRHLIVDGRPVICGRHRLPEFDVSGLVGALCGADHAALHIGDAGDRVGADILRLGGVHLYLQHHVVQAVRRQLLIHNVGEQAGDGNAANGGIAVVFQAQLDVAPVQIMCIEVLHVRPAIADHLRRAGVVRHRQRQVFLILLHLCGELQAGVEAHGHAAVHVKGAVFTVAVVEDAVLPLDIIQLGVGAAVDDGVAVAVGVLLIAPAGQRPNVLERLTTGGGRAHSQLRLPLQEQQGALRLHCVEIAHGVDVIEGLARFVFGGDQVVHTIPLVAAVHHRVEVAGLTIGIAVTEQAGTVGIAAAHEAHAAIRVDIAVFQQAVNTVDNDAEGVAVHLRDQVAAQVHDVVADGAAGVNAVSQQRLVAGIYQHSAVGADDNVLHGAVDIVEYGRLVDIFAALRLRIVIHQVIDLGIGVDIQEKAAAGGVLGDHVALEVDGAMEIHRVMDRRVLREVGCDEDMAVGVFHLRVIQLLVGGHGDVGGVRPEGDLIQRHPAVLIGGGQRGPPAVVGGQVRQLHLFVQREAAVLIFRQFQGQGLGVLVLWQLHAVRALDGQRHAGILTLAAQIAAQVRHLHVELDRGAVRFGFQIRYRQRAGQGAAAHQVDGFQDMVVFVAAEALGVVIGGGHELQAVLAAFDQSVEPQVLAQRFGVRHGFDLLGRQDRVAVVEVDRDSAVVEDGAVRVKDPQVQELRHVCRQEQVIVLDLRQRLFRHEAVVGHAHGDEVLLTALAHHGFNAEGVLGEVRQAPCRHGDAQLHGGGIVCDLLGIRIRDLVDQEAVPRVRGILGLRTVQHHFRVDKAASLQLDGLCVLIVAVLAAVGQLGRLQNGPVDLVAALVPEDHAEFVHQSQHILRGFGGHGGHQRSRGIHQGIRIDTGAEGDPAAAQGCRVDRQCAQLGVVHCRQLSRRSLSVRLGRIIAVDLRRVEHGECKARQLQLVDLAILRISQLQLLHALAAGGDIRRVPRAVQVSRSAAALFPHRQAQGGVLFQSAVRVLDLDGQRQGVHDVLLFRNDHGGRHFLRKDRLPTAGSDQRDLIAKAVLHYRLGAGVLLVGSQLRAAGGEGDPSILLGAVQHRGSNIHCEGFSAALGLQGQLQTSDIGQSVQLEILKAVFCIRLIIGGIRKGQVFKRHRIRMRGKADCPVGTDSLHIPLLDGGELDLDEIGDIALTFVYNDGIAVLVGLIDFYLSNIVILVLKVYGFSRFQRGQRKFLLAAAAALALAQHGGLALIATAGIGLIALGIGRGAAFAGDGLVHGEADVAYNGATGVVHVHFQAQRIAPDIDLIQRDHRLLVGDLGAGAFALLVAIEVARAVAGNGTVAGGAAAAGGGTTVAAAAAAAAADAAAGGGAAAGAGAAAAAAGADAAGRTGAAGAAGAGAAAATAGTAAAGGAAAAGAAAATGGTAAAAGGSVAIGGIVLALIGVALVVTALLRAVVILRGILLSACRISILITACGQIVAGIGGEFLLIQRCAGGVAGSLAVVVAFSVQDLLGLLQLFRIRRAVVGVVYGLSGQPKGVQKVGIVIGVVTDGDGRPKNSLLAVIAKSPIFLLEPADRLLAHTNNAVAGNNCVACGIGKDRPLHVYVQTVGEHGEDEFLIVRLRHILVVGNTVTEIQTVKGLIDIDIRRDQPFVVV